MTKHTLPKTPKGVLHPGLHETGKRKISKKKMKAAEKVKAHNKVSPRQKDHSSKS